MALEKFIMCNTYFWEWSKTGKAQFDNSEKVGLIVTDLSVAFDMITHSLLFTKLKVHHFSDEALSLLHSHLYNW